MSVLPELQRTAFFDALSKISSEDDFGVKFYLYSKASVLMALGIIDFDSWRDLNQKLFSKKEREKISSITEKYHKLKGSKIPFYQETSDQMRSAKILIKELGFFQPFKDTEIYYKKLSKDTKLRLQFNGISNLIEAEIIKETGNEKTYIKLPQKFDWISFAKSFGKYSVFLK